MLQSLASEQGIFQSKRDNLGKGLTWGSTGLQDRLGDQPACSTDWRIDSGAVEVPMTTKTPTMVLFQQDDRPVRNLPKALLFTLEKVFCEQCSLAGRAVFLYFEEETASPTDEDCSPKMTDVAKTAVASCG